MMMAIVGPLRDETFEMGPAARLLTRVPPVDSDREPDLWIVGCHAQRLRQLALGALGRRAFAPDRGGAQVRARVSGRHLEHALRVRDHEAQRERAAEQHTRVLYEAMAPTTSRAHNRCAGG